MTARLIIICKAVLDPLKLVPFILKSPLLWNFQLITDARKRPQQSKDAWEEAGIVFKNLLPETFLVGNPSS